MGILVGIYPTIGWINCYTALCPHYIPMLVGFIPPFWKKLMSPSEIPNYDNVGYWILSKLSHPKMDSLSSKKTTVVVRLHDSFPRSKSCMIHLTIICYKNMTILIWFPKLGRLNVGQLSDVGEISSGFLWKKPALTNSQISCLIQLLLMFPYSQP